jgi:anti-sigma factor RsiW
MICCREVAVLLLEYASHELPPDRCREVDDHLCECGHCQNYVTSYLITISLCKQLPCPPAPESLMAKVKAACRCAEAG